jgi:hypothetical protein
MLWEQLLEYFEVRFRAEKYGVPYFLAESEAKQSAPREEAVGARARNAVEDLNGGHRREALGVGRLSHRWGVVLSDTQPLGILREVLGQRIHRRSKQCSVESHKTRESKAF